MTILDQPKPIAQGRSPLVYRLRVPSDLVFLPEAIIVEIYLWRGDKASPSLVPKFVLQRIPNVQRETIVDVSNIVKSELQAPPTASYKANINLTTTEGVWLRIQTYYLLGQVIGPPTVSETVFVTKGWTTFCQGINPQEDTHLGKNYPTPFGYVATQLGYFAESPECIPQEVQDQLTYTRLGCANVLAQSVDLTPYGVKHGYAFNQISPTAASPFRMFRTSDFAEADAIFENNGHLDCNKIAAFASNSRVYIRRWYDQFGDTGTDYKHLTGFFNQGVGAPNKLQPSPNTTLANLTQFGVGVNYPSGIIYAEPASNAARSVQWAQTQASPLAENVFVSLIVKGINPRKFRFDFADNLSGFIEVNTANGAVVDSRLNVGLLTTPIITFNPLGGGFYQFKAQYHRTAGALAANLRAQVRLTDNSVNWVGNGLDSFELASVMVSTFSVGYYPPAFIPEEASSLIYDPAFGFIRGAISQGADGMENNTFNTLPNGSYALLSLGYIANPELATGGNNQNLHISAVQTLASGMSIGFAGVPLSVGSSWQGIPVLQSGATAPATVEADSILVADYNGSNLATITDGEQVVIGSTSNVLYPYGDLNTIRVNGGSANVVTRVALIFDRLADENALIAAVRSSWLDLFEGNLLGEEATTSGFPDSGFLLTDAARKICIAPNQPYTISVYPEYINSLLIADDAGNNYVLSLAPYAAANNSTDKLVHINVGTDWISRYGLAPNHAYTVEGLNSQGGRVTYRYCFQVCCEYRYPVMTIAFVNRFGVWDYFTFFKRSDWTQNRMAQEWMNNTLYPYTTGNYYEPEFGHKHAYNVNGMRTISVNTDWLTDAENERIRDIFMSEQIVLIDKEANCRFAVLLRDDSFLEKRTRNEKLIQYTFSFESAFLTRNTTAV